MTVSLALLAWVALLSFGAGAFYGRTVLPFLVDRGWRGLAIMVPSLLAIMSALLLAR